MVIGKYKPSSAKKSREPKVNQECDDVSSSMRTKNSREKKVRKRELVVDTAQFKNNNDSSAAINQDQNSDISFRSDNNEINLNRNDEPKPSWRKRGVR